mmetsp:Transcript_13484/g.24152  ORF Transcript_13484/g.24152 Transcript_13484/m.24152 type:complete len:86 (-) Transcript_13484:4758-5015(-)
MTIVIAYSTRCDGNMGLFSANESEGMVTSDLFDKSEKRNRKRKFCLKAKKRKIKTFWTIKNDDTGMVWCLVVCLVGKCTNVCAQD